MLGGRTEPDDHTNVVLADPLLVPVEGHDRYMLLLAEGSSRALVDRSRAELEPADASRTGKLEVTSVSDVSLWVAGQRVRVGESGLTMPLAPGDHAFLAEGTGAPRMAGAVFMPPGGFVELALDPKRSSVALVVHAR